MFTTNSFTLGLYEKSMPDTLSLIQKLIKAKQVGYDFLEMSIDETDYRLSRLDYSHKEKIQLRNEITSTDFSIGSICLSGHRKFPLGSLDKKIRTTSLDIMKKAVDIAGFLGIPIIQLAGYDVYYEESTEKTKELFVENLAISTQIAARSGIILGFETMETPFMNSVTKALHYVSLINCPYLQIYPDLGNIVNAADGNNSRAKQDLINGKGHLIATHIKESVPGKYREIPYGTGHVDFPLLLETCWELGVRRFVTEFWHNSSLDWEKQLTTSFEYINNIFFHEKRE
jgi:L-ribulose-5-phosphate 3-epimerase